MRTFLYYLERLVVWLSYISLVFLIGICFIQIVCRYAFNNSLSWPEEVSRYLFIAISFFGATLTMRSGGHLRVDILLTYSHGKFKMFLHCLAYGISALYCVICGLLSIEMISETIELGQEAITVSIPIWVTWLPITFGSFAMAFYALLQLYVVVTNSKILCEFS